MSFLAALPDELLCLIMEHLVMSIGIYKAVFLRSVNRSFNAAVLQAICVSHVVDIDDPAVSDLRFEMPASLRGQIYLVKSRSSDAGKHKYLSVIAKVNEELDSLTQPSDERRIDRHQRIAEAEQIDDEMEARNLLCGAIVLGDLSLITSLQTEESPMVADVNGPSPYFGWPLPLAAAWGHFHIVKYLLQHGADPHLAFSKDPAEDWNPKTDLRPSDSFCYRRPTGSGLQAAVLGGHEVIVRLLLEPKYRLAPTKAEYFRAIVAGARGGHLHLIQLLLQTMDKNISDLPRLGEQMLWEAVCHGQVGVVQMLLRSGINVDAYPSPNVPAHRGTLSVAAAQGNVRMVRLLLEEGSDVNCSINHHGEQSIERAAQCGQEEVVELLLEHGADPLKALLSAAAAGQARVVKLLLARDPDLINQIDSYTGVEAGRWALSKAIRAKNPNVISLLVNAGVPLNDGYDLFELPIFVAKAGAAPWIVDYLISIGAEDQDFEGYPDNSPRFLEVDIESTPFVGQVHVTRRTWEWVGKY